MIKQAIFSLLLICSVLAMASTVLGAAVPSAVNVALASNGASATGGWNVGAMIDGITTGYTGTTGFAVAQLNTPMTITLNKMYTINQINVLLWDGDTRYYRYKVEASTDNLHWKTIVDKTSGIWRSWQKDTISPIDAKYVRITGTSVNDRNTVNDRFHVVEMEVYSTGSSPATVPTGYTLVWDDEFNDNTLNSQNWNVGNGPSGNVFASYTPDNVFVNNGYLTLKSNYQNGKYTSAGVHTNRKFSQTYGYFEMRARLPKGLGLWNSFYLMPQVGWPPEIDIFENNGKWSDTVRFATHWGTQANHLSRGAPYSGPDFSQNFHTFAVEWQKGKIRWFVDNVQRYETDSDVPVPDTPFYININTAIGIAQWAGYPDQSTIFPQYYDIDYVRVYEKSSI